MRMISRGTLSLSLLLLGALSLTSCDLFLLFQQLGANYHIPLGTNRIDRFTCRSPMGGERELDWEGTVRVSRVDVEDIPYEEVTYWCTDEQGNVVSETLTFLKNAMGNHAPVANPIYDGPSRIDLFQLKIDRGEGPEHVDIYVFPDKFGMLSWALEGNSEENPLLFDPMATYGNETYRKDAFVMNPDGWELSFQVK